MTILSITAIKPSQESKLGIAFTRSSLQAPLTIKSVKEDSVFANTALVVGMRVHQVLGQEMMWKTPKDAAEALRTAPQGQVTLTVDVAVGEIVKSSPDQKLGLALKNSTTQSGIFISKIDDDGVFAGTELKEGMKVLSINGVSCLTDTNVKQAIALVKDAPTTLTIVAHATTVVPPPAVVQERTQQSKQEQQAEEEEEEKKEQEGAGAAAEGLVVDDDDHPSDEKGIIDKIFATCIC